MAGLPTVLITTDPESSAAMRPPRAIHPEGFARGHTLGRARQSDLQRQVLVRALAQFHELHMPGEVQTFRFSGY